MKRLFVLSLFPALTLLGCATTGPQTAKTQLQIREYQTRSYQTTDTKMVLKAIVNVLQDEGFIIKEANTDLGILSATKEVDVESTGQALVATLFLGSNAKWNKNSVYEATANVSEFGAESRVRMIFQVKTYDNKGGVSDVKQIEDANYYQSFFSKVDKGVFIEKEKL